jgi:hypothetical protein
MTRHDEAAAEVTSCAFAALGEQHWWAYQFTASVPMMVATLRNLKSGQLFMPQSLIDYAARRDDRSAFQAVLAAKMRDFAPDQEGMPT